MVATVPKTATRISEKLVRKRVSSLKSPLENLDIYEPVDRDDPAFQLLASSIAKYGLREKIVITKDGYIVSGNRRTDALRYNGQTWTECRVLNVKWSERSPDERRALLREYNIQRNKTVAEQIREELIDIDPDEAHYNLLRRRQQSVYRPERNGVESLQIETRKKRPAISKQLVDHVKYTKQVIFEDLADYWPLSDRGIHYALLNYEFYRNIPRKIPYLNDDKSYKATCKLLLRLRLDGEIPWEAISDGTRPVKEFRAFTDVREFTRQEMNCLFDGYWRDCLQSQPNHVEVLCEKNTVYHMVLSVTEKYRITTMSGRGFCSIDPYHEMYLRYLRSGKQRLIVIVLSDFDPEGQRIPHSCGHALQDDLGGDLAPLTESIRNLLELRFWTLKGRARNAEEAIYGRADYSEAA